MAILFLLPLLVHLVAGTMVPQEGGKNGNRTGDNTRGVLVLRALHSGRGSAGEITYRGNVLTKAFLDNHETVLLPNLRFLHLGRLLVGVSATSK